MHVLDGNCPQQTVVRLGLGGSSFETEAMLQRRSLAATHDPGIGNTRIPFVLFRAGRLALGEEASMNLVIMVEGAWGCRSFRLQTHHSLDDAAQQSQPMC